MFTSFQHGIREGINSVKRAKGKTLWAALALMFVVLIAHAVTIGVSLLGTATDGLEQRVDIPLFINEAATDLQVDNFRRELNAWRERGDIDSYYELDKDEAFEVFQRSLPNQTVFLERHSLNNPLATRFGIIPVNDAQKVEELEQWLGSDRWYQIIDQASYSQSQKQRQNIRSFLNMLTLAQSIALVIQGMLFVIIALIVMHISHLLIERHQQEFDIKLLVGASFFAIATPIILEVVIIALLGIVLSIVTIVLLQYFVAQLMSALVSSVTGSDAVVSLLTGGIWESLLLNIIIVFVVIIAAATYSIFRHVRS